MFISISFSRLPDDKPSRKKNTHHSKARACNKINPHCRSGRTRVVGSNHLDFRPTISRFPGLTLNKPRGRWIYLVYETRLSKSALYPLNRSVDREHYILAIYSVSCGMFTDPTTRKNSARFLMAHEDGESICAVRILYLAFPSTISCTEGHR